MKRLLFSVKLSIFYALVAVLLLVNKALIRIVPFKKLIEWYANAPVSVEYNDIDKNRAKLIHDALNRFNKILFWQPVCFEQSLTVMVLARLFHLPGTVFFGIKKTDHGEMLAHAWSQIGNYWITGYANKDDFTVVYKMHYRPVKGKVRYE